MNIHRRIIGYYRPFLASIAGALAVMILSIGFNLLKPWPVKYVVDGLLVNDDKLPWWIPVGSFGSALLSASVALVLIHLIWGVLNMLSNYWLIEIGLKALIRLRAECFEKLHVLSLRFHNHHNSSDLVYRVAYDTQSIQTFFNRGFATVVGSGLTLVGILVVMWQMNVFLTLLSLSVVPFLLAAIFFFAQRVKKDSVDVQERESRVLRLVNDSLRNLRLVRVMNRRFLEKKSFDGACGDSLEASRSLNRTNLASTLAVGVVTAAGSALLLYYGAAEVQAGRLEVGDLWVFLSYLAMFYQPLEQLSYTAWAVAGASAGAERVFEVLDNHQVEDEGKHLPDLPQVKGTIACEGVGFSYEKNNQVLSNVSFRIEAGQTVAFVGGTGAGKTTLLSLIPRLYHPEQGMVSIDGFDISQYNRFSLRSQMSMVLQDTLLVDGTILENLRYARPEATEDECWAAVEAAQATLFIRALPDKLDTDIGEQGVRLSGGQRQRLGIARAILRDSPVLLLDEPTSSLDLKTEADLMGALKAASSKPTTLIVTHRLHTIHDCDRIFVLHAGKIAETGTGPELLEQNGLYSTLYHS